LTDRISNLSADGYRGDRRCFGDPRTRGYHSLSMKKVSASMAFLPGDSMNVYIRPDRIKR
jgi:hypothetical protein